MSVGDEPEIVQAEHLIDINRPDEALAALAPLFAREPGNPAPHLVAARAHLHAARPAKAQEAAKRALNLDPEEPFAAYLVGIALLAGEDVAGAKSWIDQSIEMQPLFATAHAVRARIDLLEHRPNDALDRAEHAIELDPDEEFCHHTLGIVLHEQGRYRAAEDALRHALSIAPDDATTLSDLAETLAARGRPRDAAELLRLAARADVRKESIQQDMLRYVRRAAGGLATWPIIVSLLLIAVISLADPGRAAADQLVGGFSFLAIAAALVVARERRLRRFPQEVRRLLNRRSRTRAGFEIEVKGKRGFRPWWWLIIARIPLNVRAFAMGAWWLLLAGSTLLHGETLAAADWLFIGGLGVIPAYLLVKATRARARATQAHPFYPGAEP